MYRVLIAEDEMFVRLGIKMSVDWEKMGMEVIGDVANGKAAWQIYEQEHPEIILTDIRMPVMDGMELIRKIREKDRNTRIIILSCLEEFELVREAISMGVSDYILKLTMTQEDMEKVLGKVKTELDLLEEKNQKKAEGTEELQRKLLDFLYYEEYRTGKIEKLSLPMGDKNLIMASLEINNYSQVQERFRDEYGALSSSALQNILEELLRKCGKGLVLREKETRYLLICAQEEIPQKSVAEYHFTEMITNIQKTLALYFQISVAAGISQLFDGYENLKTMYRQCCTCMEQRFYHAEGEQLRYYEIKKEDSAQLVREQLEALKKRTEISDKIRNMLEGGSEVFQKKQNPQDIISFFVHMVDIEVADMVMNYQKGFSMVEEYIRQMNCAASLSSLTELFLACLSRLHEKQETGSVVSKTVADILYYVSKHYTENLTLEAIADSVELSPNYVCVLFKKEMGINLSAYILEYRVNRAKELLLSTNLKAYEIAEKTGFSDDSYFNRSFKKITGQSPGDFKKTVYHNEGKG